MFNDWMGTVGFALLWLAVIAAMLRVAMWVFRDPPTPPAPHDVVDALGRLADAERMPFMGKLPTLTEQERRARKARLYLVSERTRGRAR